jgi:hypothetical protein
MTVREPQDYNDSIENLLKGKMIQVLLKEMQGRIYEAHGRGLSIISSIEIFDFLEVGEPDDERESRFIMVLYIEEETNMYHPRAYEGCDFYPMGFPKDWIRNVFRHDLEKGKMPKSAFHQTSARPETSGNRYDTYQPLCLEVTDRNDIREIQELIGEAIGVGIREDIINKRSEDIGEILERIENDDSNQKIDYHMGKWFSDS